ncbi:MAG TPA: hypothetical protein VHI13_09105 [Candidatus Kapabacteria bacterium]|nr:hypothetical protein [Candidatus Kapabacteria bacterium]
MYSEKQEQISAARHVPAAAPDPQRTRRTGRQVPHNDAEAGGLSPAARYAAEFSPGCAPVGVGVNTEEPKKLRTAEVEYDPDGNALKDRPLSEEVRNRLADLLQKLKEDDPTFYEAIENEDVVVTRGSLPENNIGRHIMHVTQTTREKSKLYWFLVDQSKADLSKGEPNPDSAEWQGAIEQLMKTYPERSRQDALAAQMETRVIKGTFSSVIILDIDQIDKRQEEYRTERAKYMEMFQGIPPTEPPSALGTLRHEAGHLLFERAIQYDNLGNPLPSKPLDAKLKQQVEQNSYDNAIATDMDLLSEYAAESVGRRKDAVPFNLATFKEENDPRFGVGGYHDVDGAQQLPAGFGVRVATGLALIAAKEIARAVKVTPDVPVYLLTVPHPETEQRRFAVFMLRGNDRKTVRNDFNNLKGRYPALATYSSTVAEY